MAQRSRFYQSKKLGIVFKAIPNVRSLARLLGCRDVAQFDKQPPSEALGRTDRWHEQPVLRGFNPAIWLGLSIAITV
jgi:hypothetical protein